MPKRRTPAERTLRTGKPFEREVFEAVKKALEEGGLGWHAALSRVYHQKGYFSKDRKKDIKFDVTVELTLPGASSPSIIWVWECKDYSSPIPVDDIEEFHAKLQQIGADRTKGAIITRGTYQESAMNYAQSMGIGLARLLPESQVDWVISRAVVAEAVKPSAIRLTERALVELPFNAENQDFFGFTGGGRTRLGLTLGLFIELCLDEWGLLKDDISQ